MVDQHKKTAVIPAILKGKKEGIQNLQTAPNNPAAGSHRIEFAGHRASGIIRL